MAEPSDDADDPGNPLYWKKLLEESAAPFEHEPAQQLSLETLRGIYASVLAAHDHTCALTGAQFAAPEGLLHDQLQLAPIRPLPMGGALHVSNFLCLESSAAAAFGQGHITVGPRFELVVDLSRIDPELLERLNPLGRLRLPATEVAQPDPLALAYHREHIFLGR